MIGCGDTTNNLCQQQRAGARTHSIIVVFSPTTNLSRFGIAPFEMSTFDPGQGVTASTSSSPDS